MPSIRIYATKLEPDIQAKTARVLTGILKDALKVPIVEIFFVNLDTVYVNGEAETDKFMTMMIEGPEYELEKGNKLCHDLCEAFRTETGRTDCSVSFVYHVNNHDHIGSNGTLLNLRKRPV